MKPILPNLIHFSLNVCLRLAGKNIGILLSLIVLIVTSACKTTPSENEINNISSNSDEQSTFKPLYCGANVIKKHNIVAICLGHIAGKDWPGIKTFTAVMIETKVSKNIYEVASHELLGDDLNISVNFEGEITHGQIEIKDWQKLTPAKAHFAGARIDSFSSVEESQNKLRWRASEVPVEFSNLLSTYLEAKGLKSRKQEIAELEPHALVTVTYFKIRVHSHFIIRFSSKIGDVGPIIRSTPSRYEFVGEVRDGKYFLFSDKVVSGTLKMDIATTRFSNLIDLNQERIRTFLEFSGYTKRGVDPVRAIDRDAFELQFFTVDGTEYEYLTAVKSARKIGGVFQKDSMEIVGRLVDGKITFFSRNEFQPDIEP